MVLKLGNILKTWLIFTTCHNNNHGAATCRPFTLTQSIHNMNTKNDIYIRETNEHTRVTYILSCRKYGKKWYCEVASFFYNDYHKEYTGTNKKSAFQIFEQLTGNYNFD